MPRYEPDRVHQLRWWEKAWHDYQDRRAQKKFTKYHRARETQAPFRLSSLNEGHFLGTRSWCDTQLRPCPDFPWRRCCPCSHQEAPGGS